MAELMAFSSIWAGWCCGGSFQAPAQFQARTDQASLQTVFRAIQRWWQWTTWRLNQAHRTFIPRLLLTCGPSAILWRVGTIVVNAIYRVTAAWSWTHVRKECREAISPTSTDCNPSASVMFIGWVFGIFASTNHATPCLIFTRMLHSVFQQSNSSCLAMETAATQCISASQVMRSDRMQISTVATTAPICRISARAARLRNHQQSANPLTDPIFLFHNGIIQGDY